VSCDTGGKLVAASVSRRRAHGEDLGGASLGEANGDDGNWRDKMTLAAMCEVHRRHRKPWLQERNNQ
jgi:hypothetical protein